VFINGQVFLEIVDDHEEGGPFWDERHSPSDESHKEEDPEGNGTWIGELVPFSS
jgi:hypothetical protein